MTLMTALNSAMSGLRSNAQVTEVISQNIANALTPGYARREVILESGGDVAPGVRVSGIRVFGDPAMVGFRREAETDFGNAEQRVGFLKRIESRLGVSGSGDTLGDLLNRFESALVSARSSPESDARLNTVFSAASEVATRITAISQALSDERSRADQRIGSAVRELGTALKEVRDLNIRITENISRSVDISDLRLRRKTLVDGINALVPVNEIARDNGKIALYSQSGHMLLDGPAAEISFNPVARVGPDMAIENGAVSHLRINDVEVDANGLGGEIGAQFEIRDSLAPDILSKLDALSLDLVERVATHDPADPGQVPELSVFAVGAPGAVQNLVPGASARLRVNTAISPQAGGSPVFLRDGLGNGDPGDGRRLDQLVASLSSIESTSGKSVFALVEEISSNIGANRIWAEDKQTRDAARLDQARKTEAQTGVDTDVELQHLLEVEKAYAANARVIETINTLFDDLLRI